MVHLLSLVDHSTVTRDALPLAFGELGPNNCYQEQAISRDLILRLKGYYHTILQRFQC